MLECLKKKKKILYYDKNKDRSYYFIFSKLPLKLFEDIM